MSAADAALRAAVESGALACVAAMAATRDGVIYEGAFGMRDPQAGAAMATDSVGWIASMTKAIVSVAALQQVEQGRLSLDGPISEVLPDLANPMVLEGFDDAGNPVLRPARRAITLRHLLTHTAGYGYNFWNPELARWMERTGAPRIPNSDAQLAAHPLLFDPGDRWNYGINTDVVGRAVEAAVGKRLDACLAEGVTDRLGMADTMFVPRPAQLARRLMPHQRGADGSLIRVEAPVATALPFMAGGGGLYGTARDYLAFVRAVLTRDAALLGPVMFDELERNQIGALEVTPMVSAMPAASRDVALYPGMRLEWTLAFLRNTAPTPEGRAAGSLAWAGLPNCYYWIDPARGVCGVFVTSLLPFADPAALAAFTAYERAIYAMLG